MRIFDRPPVSAAMGFVVLALHLGCGSAIATENPNRELGKALFESTALASNGKSCASCHPDGKGLQELDAYDDNMLREMINFCIRDALKGKMLPNDAQELESMRLYLRSLQR